MGRIKSQKRLVEILCEEAKEAGVYKMDFADEDVLQRIKILKIVLAYLGARRDSGVVEKALHLELMMHEDNARARGITL